MYDPDYEKTLSGETEHEAPEGVKVGAPSLEQISRPLIQNSETEYAEMFRFQVSRVIRNQIKNQKDLFFEQQILPSNKMHIVMKFEPRNSQGRKLREITLGETTSARAVGSQIDGQKIISIRPVIIKVDKLNELKNLTTAFVYTVEPKPNTTNE